jgi:ribulose-5-phosphate 4-epimerase/fuculose-1-phosphate aldolase
MTALAPGAAIDEGVIKFTVEHTEEPLDARRHGDLICQLVAWREILQRTQLVGQDPARYGGAGYGNVSARVGPPGSGAGRRAFLVTGTQTGGKLRIGLGDFCVIEAYDSGRNWVRSRGPLLPSSESMTHGALFDLSPHIRFVLHAHSPTLWRRARTLRLPTTDPAIGYGTPAMARAVQALYRTTALSERKVLAMGGHEDGIIAFGHTAHEAGQALITELARAYERECLE